jgi:SAM-dependent methyltransferase
VNCPICGGASSETLRAKYVSAAKCSARACGHIWAIGVPSGYGVQSGGDRAATYDQFEERNRELARFLKRRRYLTNGSRLLDMGAGHGHIADVLREAIPDLDVVAVEADLEGLANLRRLGFSAYATLDEVPGDFDAINLVEVIEHLDDPVRALASLRQRLRRNGKLFCTTPCGETRRGSRLTNAYDTPEHVQFFTERSLELCFSKAGFAEFSFETINAMTSKLTPPPLRYVKDLLRPLRARIWGHQHLTGFARP